MNQGLYKVSVVLVLQLHYVPAPVPDHVSFDILKAHTYITLLFNAGLALLENLFRCLRV